MRQSTPIASPPARAIAREQAARSGRSRSGSSGRRPPRARASRVRRDELLVVGRREHADPRVEELDRVSTGRGERRDVRRELIGEPLHERMPHRRLAVHERLRPREVAARLALDEIARDGERSAAEADERALGVELARARSVPLRESARPTPPAPRRAAARRRRPSASARRSPARLPRRASRRTPSRGRAT